MSKGQVYGKIVLVLLVLLKEEIRQCIGSMNCTVYSLFQFNLYAFYNPNNITTKLNLKFESYFQS